MSSKPFNPFVLPYRIPVVFRHFNQRMRVESEPVIDFADAIGCTALALEWDGVCMRCEGQFVVEGVTVQIPPLPGSILASESFPAFCGRVLALLDEYVR